ncbi:hypothetical protein FT663_03280 [Candidozyma haemuli var. vulneris]|uniref:Uncharacterized protein n=1 Tax=Candidozyma haemuli TaxID=45357 RepID=A0A2V1AM16_9ASCO|nr:hypothetical protein CXQ85_003176 [[Candida] haemuloni]KAF3990236.1 hypothetical protein FT663_03280 [[Candida] haemuloni var. vulneris]KAF3990529.1 hypothetical protein FT662_02214 [[Candida] haemuloni var. vulneris]PVH19337.1 hypothetical protein CXQ85_003176 [[Candida] haemuloni]
MPIQNLEPDFAIGVKRHNVSPKDSKASQTVADDDSNLQLLFDTLEKFGFKAQVRAGADKGTQLLVFLKITAKAYEELVKKDLLRNYEFGLTDDNSASYNKQRLIYEYLTTSDTLGGVGITPGVGQWKFVESITSLDGYLADSTVTEQAKKDLVDPTFSTAKFKNLYGPNVALYFDFVRFYTLGLFTLALFGIIGFLKSKNYSIAFSFINLIWGTVLLVLWRRRTRFLSNTWGVQNALTLERFRSELVGAAGEVQDSKQKAESDKIRFLKQLLFVPVAIGFGFILLTAQGLCFVWEIFISEIYDGPGKAVLTLTPTILLSSFVPVFTIVYTTATKKFIDWERHHSNLTRSQSFAIKSFLLNIMTGYVPLLISAFIYLPFAHLLQPNLIYIKRAIAGRIRSDRYAYSYLTNIKTSESFEINQSRLDSQYFYFIVTNQVIGSILKFGLPLILTPLINFAKKLIYGKEPQVDVEEDPQEKSWLDRVRRAAELPEYSVDDSFRDIALQFGYVTVFGSIWTLAPVVCIFFNILTFKLEEWRLASGLYFKPIVARKIDTIYPWNVAFFFLAWLGSIVSPLVASFYRHGAKPPKNFGSFGFDKASVNVGSTIGLVTVLLLSEHLFFALYFIGSKLSDLFKSEQETENDNFQNTLILRRQEFSSKKIPQISAPDDSEWSSYSPSNALQQAKSLNVYENKPQEEGGSSITDSIKAIGASTGISTTAASEGSSSVTNKKELLEKKRRELEQLQEEKRRELEARAEKGDSIVNTVGSQGEPSQAIIDDNSHVPTSGTDYEKDIDREAAASRSKEAQKSSDAGEASSKEKKRSSAAPAALAGAGGAAAGAAGAGAAASSSSSKGKEPQGKGPQGKEPQEKSRSANPSEGGSASIAQASPSNDPKAALNKEHLSNKSAERLGVLGKEGTVAPVAERAEETKLPVATGKDEEEGVEGAEGAEGGEQTEQPAAGNEEPSEQVQANGTEQESGAAATSNQKSTENKTPDNKSGDTKSTDNSSFDENGKKSSRKKSLKNLLKRK